MFTGIISGIGRIVAVAPLGETATHGKRLQIDTPAGWLDGAQPGESIALNGACMTVTSLAGARFTVDISAESLACTTGLDASAPVNLEKAMRAGDRLDGHMVSGHVDGVGVVTRFAPAGESMELRLRVPRELARYVALKGSLAVNGVSLTINDVVDRSEGTDVTINLIPHTLAQTTLSALREGTKVNLEVDLIARYVERMLGCGPASADRPDASL
jgi:riboflavin synthase